MRHTATRVLIVSAHPDDEVLGCGGTILKHHEAGDEVAWLVVTRAHEPTWTRATVEEKSREVTAVATRYGVKELFRPGLPTLRLDGLPIGDIIAAIRPAFETIRPETVYLMSPGDAHTDHQAVFNAAWSLMKGFRAAAHGPKRILLYETLSSTDAAPPLPGRQFVPTAYSDITKRIEEKLEIASLYQTEMQQEPLPRTPSAIRALARLRGAAIGVQYAEAFQVMRDVF